jgi:catechol 2,3-dioxygenase-like lactoylglutathione lyase family enzyme
MEDSLPAAALAHFVMKVKNIEATYRFYSGLGLRALDTFPGLAIVELRGGTHLLIFQKDDDQSSALQNSHLGQRPDFGSEKLDLMIAGHTKANLELYRTGLIDKGYSPSPIAERALYGHHYFSIQDPDGNGVSFYTSHCGDKPVLYFRRINRREECQGPT